MKVAVLTKPKHFEIREVPKPEIGPDDALIKVERCHICGTDIHILNGHYAADELPLVPGYEFAGTIAALGENVTHLIVGAKAVVDVNIGCGCCYYCRHNEILNCPDVQQVGISRNSAYAEYVVVPARLVICAPEENVPLDLLNTVLCENSVKGSVVGMGEDMHDAMTLLLHNRFETAAFTATTFPPDDVQRAFETLDDHPSSLKTQIVFG